MLPCAEARGACKFAINLDPARFCLDEAFALDAAGNGGVMQGHARVGQMQLAIGATTDAQHVDIKRLRSACGLALAIARDLNEQQFHGRLLPVKKHGNDMRQQCRQKRKRQRHMRIQPEIKHCLEAHIVARAVDQLLLAQYQRIQVVIA